MMIMMMMICSDSADRRTADAVRQPQTRCLMIRVAYSLQRSEPIDKQTMVHWCKHFFLVRRR